MGKIWGKKKFLSFFCQIFDQSVSKTCSFSAKTVSTPLNGLTQDAINTFWIILNYLMKLFQFSVITELNLDTLKIYNVGIDSSELKIFEKERIKEKS